MKLVVIEISSDMEFIRSCIFPHQTIWRTPVRIQSADPDGHNCNCAVLDKVNEAMQSYFRKGSLSEMSKEDLEFLPYELLKRSAKKEIHLVWDKLSDHAKEHLQDHRLCDKHPCNEGNGQSLIVDCWYCRAERESKESRANDETLKF